MFFKNGSNSASLDAIPSFHQPHRCQIPNLHPECVIWELLHPFSSNNQSLVEKTSNEVNGQEAEPTEKKTKNGLMSLKTTNKNCCFGGFLRQCIHTHDEDNGTSAELGLNSWAHCAGVQPEQV